MSVCVVFMLQSISATRCVQSAILDRQRFLSSRHLHRQIGPYHVPDLEPGTSDNPSLSCVITKRSFL